MEKEERLPTGIPGYDVLCQGGFVKDSVNLVLGNAGAGKTTFCLQFIYNGCVKYNQNGMFISFEQDIVDLFRNATQHGMDLQALEKQGKCVFMKFDPAMSVKDLQKELVKNVTKFDIRRIVFDPINVFALEFPKEISLRRQLYDFFDLLKQLDVCVVVSGESDGDGEEGKAAIAEEIFFAKYLSDSVTELFSSGIGGSGDRALRLLKMRMTSNFRGPVGMTIANQGIKILKR
jgi:circadian clock protein KaiC